MTRLITTENKIIKQKRVMFMFMFTSRAVQDNIGHAMSDTRRSILILYHALSQQNNPHRVLILDSFLIYFFQTSEKSIDIRHVLNNLLPKNIIIYYFV